MEEGKQEFQKEFSLRYKKSLDSYMNCLIVLCLLTLPYWIFRIELEIILIIFIILISNYSKIPELKHIKITGISLILFDLLTFLLTDQEINCNFMYIITIGICQLETSQFGLLRNYFRYFHIIIKIVIYYTKFFLSYEVDGKFDKFLFKTFIFTFTIQISQKLIKIHENEENNFNSSSKEFNDFKIMCENFPFGIMICEVEKEIDTGKTNFNKISYLNTSAVEILKLSTKFSRKEFTSRLINFEIVKESKPNKNISDVNLFQFIMESPQNIKEGQHCLVKCLSTNKMIVVRINEFESPSSNLEENLIADSKKVRICYKIISIENLSDEKRIIQNKIYKNLKSKFLLTISHELNNPLNGLIYYCDKIITEEDIYKRSNIIQKIKKLKFSIKFFIKNLNLTSKIILREKINMQLTMVNFSFILNKVINRFLPFLENKRIKYITNLKNHNNNIVIKTDYNYFKFFLKNVFMYVCHKIEAKKTLKMETQILYAKKTIKLNFLNQNTNKYIYQYTNNVTETPDFNSIKIGESVQTEGMLREILFTLSANLDVKILVNDSLSEYLLSCEIPFENLENVNETEDMVEFTPDAINKKDDNLKLLCRKINVTENEMFLIKNRSECKWKDSIGSFKSKDFIIHNFMNKLDENLDEKGLLKFSKIKNNTETSNFNENNIINNGNRIYDGDDEINSLNYHHHKDNINGDKNNSFPNEKFIAKKKNNSEKIKNEDNKLIQSSSTQIYCEDKSKEHEQYASFKMKKNNSYNIVGLKNDKMIHENDEKEKEKQNQLDANSLQTKNKIISKLVDNVTHETLLFKNINDKNVRNEKKMGKILGKKDLDVLKLDKTCCTFKEILVVDDEIFNISTIKFLLKNFKLIPDTCENGLSAVQKVNECLDKKCCKVVYKLILMDVMMPFMDGIEASQKIQAIYEKYKKNFPNIIIISAHDSEEILDKIKEIKVIKEFVEKPVRKSKVEEILKTFYY